jgi:hypothetical protein
MGWTWKWISILLFSKSRNEDRAVSLSEEVGAARWDWKKLARACERAGWLLLLLLQDVLEDVEATVEFGVVSLVDSDRCVESDGAWELLDEEFGIIVVVLVLVSDSGSVLMYGGAAALCLRVGVELSL